MRFLNAFALDFLSSGVFRHSMLMSAAPKVLTETLTPAIHNFLSPTPISVMA